MVFVFYYITVRSSLFLLLVSCGAGVLWAQTNDSPLFALPYSPSLDTSSMDRSVDPCTDFYHYACGAWIKKNPIPPDQARWDVYSKLNEDNERFLWGILVEASKPSPTRNLVETEIGDYFAACMDETAVEKAGIAPLKPDLDAIAALHSMRDLAAYLGRQHLEIAGNGMLFGFGSGRISRIPAARSRLRMRAAWAFPTAITTPRPTRSRKRRARSTWSTCSTCSSCWVRRRPPPRRTPRP